MDSRKFDTIMVGTDSMQSLAGLNEGKMVIRLASLMAIVKVNLKRLEKRIFSIHPKTLC